MKSRDIYLQQVALRELGFDPGPLDGDAGPKTQAARAAWEKSLNPKVPEGIAARIVDFAKDDLWIRETEGQNRGPGIGKFWTATNYKEGYANREPYCAAAVCFWVMLAAGTPGPAFELPVTPAAYGLQTWGAKQEGKGVVMVAKHETLEPGDIVVFEFSHVGIVESRCPAGAVNVQTIEANTSPNSTNNEGGGVHRRSRPRHLIRAVVRITGPNS